MTADEIHLDPVADGSPRWPTAPEAILIAACVALAGWHATAGAWGQVVDNLLFVGLFVLLGKTRVGYWRAGYAAGARTVGEQSPDVEVVDDDE